MSYTQADVDQLKGMLAAGILEVREKDTHVIFQSARELRTTLAQAEASLLGQRPQGFRAVRVSKGRYA
jgi:hypothetical protein